MEKTGTVGLIRFYARRIRRLLPASVLTLIVVAIMAAFVLPQTRWGGVAGDIRWSSGYLVNWRFANQAVDYLAADVAPSPVQHFWSLAVEEQFYLVWPFLLLMATFFARRRGHDIRRALGIGLLLVAGPSFAWSIYLTPVSPGSAYFITTTRMWELAIGRGTSHLRPGDGKDVTPAGPGAHSCRLGRDSAGIRHVWRDDSLPGIPATPPVLGTTAVIVAGTSHQDTLGGKVMSLRPFVAIGGFSYALYLWHWPFIVWATVLWGEAVDPQLCFLSWPSPLWCPGSRTPGSSSRIPEVIRSSSHRRVGGLVFGVALTGVGIVAGFWLSGLLPRVELSDASQPATITLPQLVTTQPPQTQPETTSTVPTGRLRFADDDHNQPNYHDPGSTGDRGSSCGPVDHPGSTDRCRRSPDALRRGMPSRIRRIQTPSHVITGQNPPGYSARRRLARGDVGARAPAARRRIWVPVGNVHKVSLWVRHRRLCDR